jgi:AcrR family transcriptional regulator
MKIRDADRTRGAILEAAQSVFSSRPYAEASLKDICARAGASVALVSRYFGSKEALFQEALEAALDVSLITGVDRRRLGVSLARLFTRNQPGRVNPLPMLVYASAHSGTRAIALELVHCRVLTPLGHWVGGPDGERLAAQIMAIATGYFTYRLILPLAPFETEGDEKIEAWLSDALQSIVDQAG